MKENNWILYVVLVIFRIIRMIIFAVWKD